MSFLHRLPTSPSDHRGTSGTVLLETLLCCTRTEYTLAREPRLSSGKSLARIISSSTPIDVARELVKLRGGCLTLQPLDAPCPPREIAHQ